MRMLIILRLSRNTLVLIFDRSGGSNLCIFRELDEWIHQNRTWWSDISRKVGIIPQFLDLKKIKKKHQVCLVRY